MLRYLLSLSALVALLVGCRGEAFPPLRIAPNEAHDSIARLVLLGDSLRMLDSLNFEGDPTIELYPDTNLYHTALVAYGSGEDLRCFRLLRGAWQQTDSLPGAADTLARHLPDFYILDLQRKYQSSYDLLQGKRLVLMLGNLKGDMPTKAQHQALKDKYKADSLRFVYMYLQTSDSVVRRLMKRDTLSGIAITDSLGQVSLYRTQLGIERSPKIHTLVVDSSRRIAWQ